MGRGASDIARDHTERALNVITEIMDDPFEEARDRLRAAETIIDRGHGKAAQAVIAIPASRQLAAALAGLSDEQLVSIVNAQPLPRLLDHAPAGPVVEGEVIDPLLA